MKAVIISILLGELCLLIFGQPQLPGATFCVKPSMLTNCSLNDECNNAVDCQVLEYYLQNTDLTINIYGNVTVYFLNGNYTGNCIAPKASPLNLTPTYVRIIGESKNVQIMCMYVEFNPITVLFGVQLEKMTMINWQIQTKPSPKLQILSVKMESLSLPFESISHVIIQESLITKTVLQVRGQDVTLSGCTLHGGSLVLSNATNMTLESCNLTNYNIHLLHSNILFSGDSQIAASNHSSAIFSVSSTIVLSGNVNFINNTASIGGAMALYSSNFKLMGGTHVSFVNNKATDVGGAIYIDPGYLRRTFFLLKDRHVLSACFYQIIECNYTDGVHFHFANNSAKNGGGDIYGGSLDTNVCKSSEESRCPVAINGTTSVSSDPTRVCLCNDEGEPQCNLKQQFESTSYKIHSGESFTVHAVIVGGDFGPTIGAVYSNFLTSTHFPHTSLNRQNQAISNTSCTKLNYSIYFNYTQNGLIMYLATMNTDTEYGLDHMHNCYSDVYCSHTTPLYFNISLLSCLPGFTILGEPPKCDCYPALRADGVQCKIINGTGYFSWTINLWMNIKDKGVIYSKYCPFGYCSERQKPKNLQNNPNTQCSFNRAGPLCGGCRENYSLAIGSSHCVPCSNDNNMSLLIFFTAAGFLLVFFINTLNLTVTQGMITGLIFYANIVWTYQSIFFPQEQNINPVLLFLKVFIAWINLDFGIEICFINGLNAFWKTWLQFIFPFYIWAIAGLIIVFAKYSVRLTELLGNKAVPTLDTLFLLSYMKLLRIVVATLEFSYLTYTDQNLTSTQYVVWSMDGNYPYFNHPHIILFVAGLATFLFLWLPYTLFLFLMQWLRRLPLPNWITQFHPVYDAYFAPLKHKHQYWFGVLLLARTMSLMVFVSIFAIPQYISLLLLLVTGVLLTLYIAIMQPYNSTGILINESSFFANLAILAGFALVTSLSNFPTLQSITIGLSAGVAFIQFCSIILYAIINNRCKKNGWCNYNDRRELSTESDFIENIQRDLVENNDEVQLPLLSN